MAQQVTIADVAAAAQVHPSTASRALNSATEHQVNADTAARVKAAARQLGYIPNVVARGLRTKSSMTVGVVIPDLTNPLFPPIIRGIEDYLSPRGYTALLANTDGRLSVERGAVDSLLERQVDGFILASGLEDHPWLSELYEAGVKAVMVNRSAGKVPYPLVTGDDAAGVAAAVSHLASLGHQRIVHLAGPHNFSTSRVRREAFEQACRQAKGVRGAVVAVPALSVEAGVQAVDDLLIADRSGFTAIVASNDMLALGALRSLRAHGVRCPEDVSVVGFNDMPFAEDFNPPLTTVHIPHQEIGAESARILLEDIGRASQEYRIVRLPASLIVRSSTGPAPAGRT